MLVASPERAGDFSLKMGLDLVQVHVCAAHLTKKKKKNPNAFQEAEIKIY